MLPPLCCQNVQVMHAKSTPKELVVQMDLAQNWRRYNSDDTDIYMSDLDFDRPQLRMAMISKVITELPLAV
jgi:hypothetical protein